MKIWYYTPKNSDDIFIVFIRLKNDPNNEVKNTVEKIIKELKINSERIAKNDEVNLVEDKLKENKEYKLKELEETDKQEKTVNHSKMFVIKSMRKKSVNTTLNNYKKEIGPVKKIPNMNAVGTRNNMHKFISFNEIKDRTLRLPNFGRVERNSSNIKVRKLKFTPDKYKFKRKNMLPQN